jgi:5S rRNA maturation endonuclease (ribonuclease M5)
MLLSDKIKNIEEEVGKVNNFLAIVEGKKDRKALEQFGFKRILEISFKKPEDIIEEIKNEKSVFIMTDFDEEGEKKLSQLTTFLTKYGIKADTSLRKKFKSLFKIQKFEELSSITKLTKSLEDDYHGKACSIYNKIFNRSRFHNRRNGGEARHNWRHIRPD